MSHDPSGKRSIHPYSRRCGLIPSGSASTIRSFKSHHHPRSRLPVDACCAASRPSAPASCNKSARRTNKGSLRRFLSPGTVCAVSTIGHHHRCRPRWCTAGTTPPRHRWSRNTVSVATTPLCGPCRSVMPCSFMCMEGMFTTHPSYNHGLRLPSLPVIPAAINRQRCRRLPVSTNKYIAGVGIDRCTAARIPLLRTMIAFPHVLPPSRSSEQYPSFPQTPSPCLLSDDHVGITLVIKQPLFLKYFPRKKPAIRPHKGQTPLKDK